MTADDVRQLLRAEVTKAGSEAKFALKLGVSRGLIYAMLNGTRDPGGRVLKYLGIEVVKVKGYRRVGVAAKP